MKTWQWTYNGKERVDKYFINRIKRTHWMKISRGGDGLKKRKKKERSKSQCQFLDLFHKLLIEWWHQWPSSGASDKNLEKIRGSFWPHWVGYSCGTSRWSYPTGNWVERPGTLERGWRPSRIHEHKRWSHGHRTGDLGKGDTLWYLTLLMLKATQ